MADLGSNFYLKEEHVGRVTRAAASLPQLQELNPYVSVSVGSGDLSQHIAGCQVLVCTNSPRSKLIEYNALCRAASPAVCFIAADAFGVAASVFR